MVLITDDRDGGGSAARVKQLQQSPKATAQVHPVITEEPPSFSDDDDEYLGSYDSEGEDFVEYGNFEGLPDFDTVSIASDDSFYPPHDVFADPERLPTPETPEPLSFFQACCTNNAAVVRFMIRQGVREDEARETDKNSRTALMVACYQGFLDVVMALAQCPHLDVNWQDNEGNTALITAAQAGHVMVSGYLLNYFCGVDLERRNCHGFTALMKAALAGRLECVRVLIMAGADTEARDFGRGLTPREWAWFTCRYDTAWAMTRLLERPCPRQICEAYSPEWPHLAALVARAAEPRSCLKRLTDVVRNALNIANVTNPVDDGVLDHLVTMTTALGSPFVAMACRTVCPGSPPCVGKRRDAVPEIISRQSAEEHRGLDPQRSDSRRQLFQNACVAPAPPKAPRERRSSLQTAPDAATPGAPDSPRRSSLLSLNAARRSSVRPCAAPPKVTVSKAPPPTFRPDSPRRRGSHAVKEGEHLLQLPVWRYKELKEERKRAEEAERKKQEAAGAKIEAAKKKRRKSRRKSK